MLFCLLLGTSCLLSAETYKWVDEHGITHHSLYPPEKLKALGLKTVYERDFNNSSSSTPNLKTPISEESSSNLSYRNQVVDTAPPTPSNTEPKIKSVPQGTQNMVNAFTKSILKDHGDAEQLDCSKAVSNAHYSIDNMLDVGKRNVEGGYGDKNKFKKISADLKKARRQITLSECRSAKGQVAGFYKCMSNDYNHIMNCGKKYNYGD
jgi:hypothetical protein